MVMAVIGSVSVFIVAVVLGYLTRR